MLAVGLLTRLFLLSTWYLLYPRLAILSFILVASVLYIDPFDVNNQLKGTWEVLVALFSPSSSQQQVVQAMNMNTQRLDLHKIRRLSFILFFVIPTVLEIRTFSFLSRINAEQVTNAINGNGNSNGWTTTTTTTTSLLYCYNIGVTVCIFIVMIFLLKVRGMKPCDASYRGLLILYGSSLLITIVRYDNEKNDIRRIPLLAAPFLTAMSTLLLIYQDDNMEWLSRIIRHTFRLSLRDVLSSVSERVNEDEMLQLAILRWICDFWASNPASTTPQTKEGTDSSASNVTSSSSQSSPEEHTIFSTTINSSTGSTQPPSFEPNDIRWEELQPMLNIEIDHMETEIDALRSKSTQSGDSDDSTYAQQIQSDAISSISSANSSHHQKQQNHHNMQSLVALKSMLLSFNVDDRAQPAVLAYRRAVESFPPKKRTAVMISILRRCPALLTVIFHIFCDIDSLFISSVILSPFLVMEYYRIVGWMEACQRFAPTTSNEIDEQQIQDWRIPACLESLDTMTILLSGDVHSTFRPPSLLMVWHNVVSSVSALEVGLSTVRCAETTAVAVEFAGSAMSLVQFGFEISQNGIFHGVMVLVNEMLSMHANGRDITNLEDLSDDRSVQYTSAAIRAVHSGQRVVKNIHALSEDQNVVPIVQPFLRFLGMLTGHKWIWGKEEKREDVLYADPEIPSSDVELRDTEIDNGEYIEAQACASTLDGSSEGNKMQTSNTFPGEETVSKKPPVINKVISVQCDLIPKSHTPEEELSQVMEMVATSYEQGLIEEKEKDDFFQKLSELRREELFDPSVISAMKRTLNIVLENGLKSSSIDDTIFSISVHKPSHDNVSDIKKSENHYITPNATDHISSRPRDTETANLNSQYCGRLSFPQIEEKEPVGPHEKESQKEQSNIQKDNLFTVGVAALGIVASGIVVTMGGNAQSPGYKHGSIDTTENANRTNEEDSKRNPSSTVEIVELTDHNTEDEWVAIVP